MAPYREGEEDGNFNFLLLSTVFYILGSRERKLPLMVLVLLILRKSSHCMLSVSCSHAIRNELPERRGGN